MEQAAEHLFRQGLAASTEKRYKAVWERYTAWCEGLQEVPLPVTEEKAIGYAVILACDGVHQGTIKQHLAGLRQAQIREGWPAPAWKDMAKLAQIRKGVSRVEAVEGKQTLQRHPVKWAHMRALKESWSLDGDKGVMLWAAACMCFFGCLRAGEALAPDDGKFDENAHLGWEDVELENTKSPKWIRVRIKESKTDRLRKGAVVTLGRTDQEICPVKAVLKHMAVRKAGKGPFFRTEGAAGLTRKVFVSEVKKALARQGIAGDGISGHSFRIGAATTAAQNGATPEELKALGRWRSREYQGYVRTADGGQAAAAELLTKAVKTEKKERPSKTGTVE